MSQVLSESRSKPHLVAAWLENTWVAHTGRVMDLSLTSDGCHAVSAGEDGTLRLWETPTGNCLRTFRGHTDTVTCIALSRDGRLALSGGVDETLRMWRLETGECLRVFSRPGLGPVTAVVLTPDDKQALFRTVYGGLYVWDVSGASYVRTILTFRERISTCLRGRPDPLLSKRAARAGLRRPMVLGDGGRVVVLGDPDRPWPRMRHLAGARGSNRFREPAASTGPHLSGGVRALAVSSDNRFVLSAGPGKTVRLWSMSSGECLRVLAGHADEISAVDISRDGAWALSGSWDKTVKIWDNSTGRYVRTLAGHSDWVNAVCLAPDLSFVLSGGADGLVQKWGLEWEEKTCCLDRNQREWAFVP